MSTLIQCRVCNKQHDDVKKTKTCSVCLHQMCNDVKCYEYCFAVDHNILNLDDQYLECYNILCAKCYNHRPYPFCEDCVNEVDLSLF